MSSSSMSKKKEIPIKDTFFHLCYDLLRFIDRKIIKKYISPNNAQLPKDKRNSDKNEDKEIWTYFYKDEKITEEEKIKDVFKDDKFLGYLQNLTNCLVIVIDYLDQNMKKIKRFEQNSKYSEEKLSVLNDLKILLNNYFERTEENTDNSEQKVNNSILEDQKLMTIMNKIQSFNSDRNKDESNKKNSQNNLGVNILDNVKSSIRSNDNNKNNNITPHKADKEKENSNTSQNKDKSQKNANIEKDKSEKYNLLNRCLETLSQNKSNIINIFNSDEKDTSSKEKIEKNTLVECNNINPINPIIYKTPEIEKEDTEEIEFFKVSKKEEDKPKDKKFLNKKLEREKESDDIKDDDKDKKDASKDMNSIIINKKSLTSVKKKGKNKKKNKNINKLSTEKKEEKTQIQIPLKEDSIILPLLKPLIEKKEEIKFEEKMPERIENKGKSKCERNKKNGGENNREVLNISTKKDVKNNNKSLENEFDLELKKEFYELNATNDRTKILRDIVTSMKTVTTENYNKRINGPYLVGSYKAISALPSLNYLSSIDIMYTYKDMLLNKIIIDFTLKNIIETALNLNIIKKTDFREDENKITKINVKCTSKLNLNIIISFNILFVDIGYNINEQIISGVIYNEEKIKFSKKEDAKKFTTIILYLRTWRKKNHLFFIIPEILDDYAKKHYESNKTMGVIIFNVFYDLYNSIVISSKQKTLYEKLIKIWYEPDNKEKINKAVLAMNEIVNSRNFKSLFKIEDENR